MNTKKKKKKEYCKEVSYFNLASGKFRGSSTWLLVANLSLLYR